MYFSIAKPFPTTRVLTATSQPGAVDVTRTEFSQYPTEPQPRSNRLCEEFQNPPSSLRRILRKTRVIGYINTVSALSVDLAQGVE